MSSSRRADDAEPASSGSQHDARLDRIRALLGAPIEFLGVDPVARGDIRRKLEVYCFDCPIHTDERIARAQGYAGLVAPVTMTPLWAQPPYWAPGQRSPFDTAYPERTGAFTDVLELPFPHAVNMGSEWRYFEPLHLGDRVHGTVTLQSIVQKRTRLGDGAFLEYETRHLRQDNNLVAVNRNTLFSFEGHAQPPLAQEPVDSNVTEGAGCGPDHELRQDWTLQLTLADVVTGTVVWSPGLPLTYQRIVMGIAADRMFSSIHHNREAARASGLSDIIFNSRGIETFLEICLRRWIGLSGRLVQLGPYRMRRSAHPGDVLRGSLRVEAKERREGVGLVSLSTGVHARGTEIASGTAVVEIPLGPVP